MTVYLVFLACYDSANFDPASYRIDGLRLPDLGQYLFDNQATDEWPFELRLLRSQLSAECSLLQALQRVSEQPVEQIGQIDWADFALTTIEAAQQELRAMIEQLEANYQFSAEKSLIQVDTHIAQLCLNANSWGNWNNEDMYHRWIIFDDCWLIANQALGNAILRFAQRWDCLSYNLM